MNLQRARVVSVATLAIGLACLPMLSMRCADSSDLPADAAVDVAVDRRRPLDTSVPPLDDALGEEVGLTCSPPPGSDGFVHDWPGWTRVSGVEKCCPVDSLTDLTKAVPYEWVPCEDAGPGCLRFNAPTSDITTFSGPVVAAQIGRGTSGGASQIYISRLRLTGSAYETTTYDVATGQPQAAWRFSDDNPHCSAGINSTTDDSTMLSISLFPTTFAPTSGLVVANGKIGSLNQALEAPTGLAWNLLNGLYAGGRGAFAYLAGIATCDMHTPGAPKCLKANVGSIAPAILNGYTEFFIETEYVYALSTHGNLGWSQEYVVGPTGDVKLLRGVANTHVGGLASDGKTLTWVEVQGDMSLTNPQKIEEVWSAPLTSDPTQLAGSAKKLATLPVGIRCTNCVLDAAHG